MKLSFPLFVAAVAVTSEAHKLTVKKISRTGGPQRRTPGNSVADNQINVASASASGANAFDLNSVHDLIYIANITVGGIEYPVQLDTGSSDLFIKGDTYPIPNTNETSTTTNLTYAIGWAYGHIAHAAVEFIGIQVPSQAFVDATDVVNPALGYGAKGIAGLGFTSLSTIDFTLNGTQSSLGRSLLYNLFEANPSEPNFIAFALQRESEPGAEVIGSFSIGEFDPAYSGVTGNAPISTWPVNSPHRWNVLLDAVIVNQTITPATTKVPGAPSNKAVVLMDSGSSYTYAPKEICNAIYGDVAGAYFDSTIGYWRVPCSAEIDMALQIGGQVFPVHPLDVNPATLADPTVCLGSFVPQTFSIATDFDWLIGDNFLRSVYSVYDFGDFDSSGNVGNPYMKLLSIIDSDDASVDFHNVRGGTPRTNITFTGLNGISVAPSFAISNDISTSLEMIGKYLPAMLAIVALNALVVVICSVVWIFMLCRKRSARRAIARARTPRSRMSPMPMNPVHSYIAGVEPPATPPGIHVYEPVSMALTEDTFVPPSPAFHGFDGGKIRPGDRPKSVA